MTAADEEPSHDTPIASAAASAIDDEQCDGPLVVGKRPRRGAS